MHVFFRNKRLFTGLCLVALSIAAMRLASVGCEAAEPQIATTPVDAFINSIGVNSAISFPNTAEYHSPEKLIAAMRYLGIRTLRDHTPDPKNNATWASYIKIAKAQIRFDFLLPTETARSISMLTSLTSTQWHSHSPPVFSRLKHRRDQRMANHLWQIRDYRSAAVAIQKDLWSAVKSDPLLRNVAIYGPTLSDGFESIYSDIVALGNLSRYGDFSNAHIYGAHGHNVWDEDMPHWLPIQTRSLPDKPVVITETGYQTGPERPGTDHVSGLVAAKYTLNLLFHNLLEGISKTFIYKLADAPRDDPQTYGLYNADWSPKIAAVAIHNLTTILRHGGLGPLPQNFHYRIHDLPVGSHSLLLRGDNIFALIVWREVTIWNAADMSDLPTPSYELTMELGAKKANAAVFDPAVDTMPIATAHSVSVISASIADHPIVIAIGPGDSVSN